jgi:hypothetical protein
MMVDYSAPEARNSLRRGVDHLAATRAVNSLPTAIAFHWPMKRRW